MKPLHLIDCSLVVYMHRIGPISSRQFQAIASDLGTSITRVQRSLDSLVAAKLVRVKVARPSRGGRKLG